MNKKAGRVSRVSAKASVTKKIAPKKTVVKKKLAGRKPVSVVRRAAALKEEIPHQEMKIEEAKFYTGSAMPSAPGRSTLGELSYKELPQQYNEDVLILQIRDPWWGHIYWDLSTATQDRLKKEYPSDFNRAGWALRAYDVSYIRFDGTNAHRFFDTAVDFDARNWYLNFASPGTSWCVDLGVFLPDGRFVTVLRSNVVFLPLDGPSWVTDEEWMVPDDEFRKLYGMSVGLGPNVTSPVGRLWQERLKKDISSRGLASMGGASVFQKPKEKGAFWLVVDTELIVYGATEPDAHMTVQGRPVQLRKDGTFTLRFALPDAKLEIPVEARSARINERRVITPIVTKRTTRNP